MTAAVPAGVSPLNWRRFTHGKQIIVPVLNVGSRDTISVPADSGSMRRITEVSYITNPDSRTREAIVGLEPLPLGPTSVFPNQVVFDAHAWVLAQRPVSRSRYLKGCILDLYWLMVRNLGAPRSERTVLANGEPEAVLVDMNGGVRC